MSTLDKLHKGNTRKEGLGFEGHHLHKLKPKKVTKDKLVSPPPQEDQPNPSSFPAPSQASGSKSVRERQKIPSSEEGGRKEDSSKKDIAGKKGKKIKKCF